LRSNLIRECVRCYKCRKEVDIAEKARPETENLRSEKIEPEAQGHDPPTWAIIVIVSQGLFEVVGLGSFLAGYFLDIRWLMVTGGVTVVLDDAISVAIGVLNPIFPVLLALVLAIFFSPWYLGVFWASAAFKVLGIPASLRKAIAPRKSLRKFRWIWAVEQDL
jgi:hypothetical protein